MCELTEHGAFGMLNLHEVNVNVTFREHPFWAWNMLLV